jgi:4-oxalocrotonate tautomerase
VPIVTIQQSPRTTDLKRELVDRITAAFVDVYDIDADLVQIYIHEIEADNWALAGTLAVDRASGAASTVASST